MSKEAILESIKVCANGDPHAFEFLESAYHFLHLIDDIQDKDQPVTDEGMSEVLVRFIMNVGSNPFYQRHKLQFEALIQVSFSAWIDANRYESERKIEGIILKSWYHEIFWHAAQLTGGWELRRKVSLSFRNFKTNSYAVLSK